MKVTLIGILAAWTTWLALYVHATPQQQQHLTVTFSMHSTKPRTTTDPQYYSDFITQVRYAIQSQSDTCHGLPMASGPNPDPEFLVIHFETKDKQIQVGFQRSDFSLQGYSDDYQGSCRFRIFTNSNPRISTRLCGTKTEEYNSTIINNIGYENSYVEIEKKAGVDRSKFGVGVDKIWDGIRKVYGKSMIEDKEYEKNEAELLLVLNQIIVEAGRFKYIENNVRANISGEYIPDRRVVSLEDNWSQVSELIANQMDPSVSFEMPKGMVDDKGEIWKMDSVDNLKDKYVSLLTYVSDCKVKKALFDSWFGV